MAINADKPHLWKADLAQSIASYDKSFLHSASAACRTGRVVSLKQVLADFEKTGNLRRRQYAALKKWLVRNGYRETASNSLDAMPPGTFTFSFPLSAKKKQNPINNIPADCIVKPIQCKQDQPIVIEAKSIGNAASAIRKRKQDPRKFAQLKERYGINVKFILLLCGHFDPFYLGHQAAEGVDWVWEHRLDDLSEVLVGSKKAYS